MFKENRDFAACHSCGEVLYGADAVDQHRCDLISILSDEEPDPQPIYDRIAPKRNKKPTNQTPKNMDIKDEEALIMAVQARQPLWNISSSVAERHPQHINELWAEVSEELNGILTLEQCKAKFRILKETYRKIIQNEVRPSGSAASESSSKWRLYKIMEFLRDSCLVKKTRSNDEETSKRKTIEKDESAARKNKKNKSEKNAEVMNKIADAICSPAMISLPPTLPPPDEIDGFSAVICARMRKMIPAARDQFMVTTMKAAFEAPTREE